MAALAAKLKIGIKAVHMHINIHVYTGSLKKAYCIYH
jgi:hypothetical protein